MKKVLFLLLAALACTELAAQKYPERRITRSANKQYEKSKFVEAEIGYRRALEKSETSYEAAANLAKTLYKQERFEEASQILAPLLENKEHPELAAQTAYDAGNALFKQRKLEEALEAYKQSLRINPGDMEAKFNLAYVQKLLDKDKNGGGGGGGNDNQNQDQNQNNQNNQDNQNGQNPPPKKDQQPQGDKPQPQDGGQDQQQGGMSKEEADRMLEAMQMNEDKTREHQDAEKVKAAGARPAKNW